MKIGLFEINLLDTGIFALDGGAMFGVIPKALWSKAYDQGDELNRIPLSARPLLIRRDGRNILVDTGNGSKLNDKLCKIYGIDKEKSSLEKALAPVGLKPEDISDVILTHLHFDHAGGATNLNDRKIIPALPNARYYVQKGQYEWAMNPSEKDRASFFNENYEPLKSMGVLELIDGPGELFPGIELIPVSGHTKDMQLVKVSENNETLLYCADLIPTAAHIGVPFVMGYDNFPMTTIEEKKKILPRALEENWILCYEHDAFREASRLNKTDRGFAMGEEVIVNV